MELISNSTTQRRLASAAGLLICVLGVVSAPAIRARPQAPAREQAATTAQAIAPRDFTGYWVSVVTEDWRWRMVVPIKGDYASVPLNAQGRKAADEWLPAANGAAEDPCKAYGAPVILRVPGRLHIYWQDGNTLRIDTDSGTQTRLLHFDGAAPASNDAQVQGYSAASWEDLERRAAQARKPDGENARGYLKVVTTHLRPGYLRRNGIPYGANTTLEEYLERFAEPNGDIWLVATIIVTDPQYLTQPYVTHAHFKKIANASGWDPTPCRADEAR